METSALSSPRARCYGSYHLERAIVSAASECEPLCCPPRVGGARMVRRKLAFGGQGRPILRGDGNLCATHDRLRPRARCYARYQMGAQRRRREGSAEVHIMERHSQSCAPNGSLRSTWCVARGTQRFPYSRRGGRSCPPNASMRRTRRVAPPNEEAHKRVLQMVASVALERGRARRWTAQRFPFWEAAALLAARLCVI